MTLFRKQLGQSGEDLAERFLKNKGFRTLGRNVRFKFGEIDILAEDGEDVVIVEVKAKTGEEFGTPEEEVDYFKQKKLWQLARGLSQRYPGRNIRIDVVGVKAGDEPEIEHIENAVVF